MAAPSPGYTQVYGNMSLDAPATVRCQICGEPAGWLNPGVTLDRALHALALRIATHMGQHIRDGLKGKLEPPGPFPRKNPRWDRYRDTPHDRSGMNGGM